jgi:hypothetical protein
MFFTVNGAEDEREFNYDDSEKLSASTMTESTKLLMHSN